MPSDSLVKHYVIAKLWILSLEARLRAGGRIQLLRTGLSNNIAFMSYVDGKLNKKKRRQSLKILNLEGVFAFKMQNLLNGEWQSFSSDFSSLFSSTIT